jgi:hypothetical protein
MGGGGAVGHRRQSIGHSARKRAWERRYVEAFLLRSGLPHGHLHKHGDSPDFLIDTPTGRVAIEITTLNKRTGPTVSALVEAENLLQQRLADLSDTYYALGV